MSEFRVIKCSKCDAPLVELLNEKLSRCDQCGYNFGLKSQELQTSMQSKLKAYSPEVLTLIRKLKNIESTKSKNTTPVKKKSVIANLLKWYFILVFFFWILSKIL